MIYGEFILIENLVKISNIKKANNKKSSELECGRNTMLYKIFSKVTVGLLIVGRRGVPIRLLDKRDLQGW